VKLEDISGTKVKIDETETNSKIRNIKGLYGVINDFKKGYKPRSSIVWDERGDLFTDSHSKLARRMNHFSQLFNIQECIDVRQTEIHTEEKNH